MSKNRRTFQTDVSASELPEWVLKQLSALFERERDYCQVNLEIPCKRIGRRTFLIPTFNAYREYDEYTGISYRQYVYAVVLISGSRASWLLTTDYEIVDVRFSRSFKSVIVQAVDDSRYSPSDSFRIVVDWDGNLRPDQR